MLSVYKEFVGFACVDSRYKYKAVDVFLTEVNPIVVHLTGKSAVKVYSTPKRGPSRWTVPLRAIPISRLISKAKNLTFLIKTKVDSD